MRIRYRFCAVLFGLQCLSCSPETVSNQSSGSKPSRVDAGVSAAGRGGDAARASAGAAGQAREGSGTSTVRTAVAGSGSGSGGTGGQGKSAGQGGGGDAAAGSVPAACSDLSTCCVLLGDSAQRLDCYAKADSRDASACGKAMSGYCGPSADRDPAAPTEPANQSQAAGAGGRKAGGAGASATAKAGSGGSGGSATKADPSKISACADLEPCCSMPKDDDDQKDCRKVVANNDAKRCVNARDNYCEDATLECMRLAACCAMQTDDDDRKDCQKAVDRAEADHCADRAAKFCPI
jgi:hypothetical protein